MLNSLGWGVGSRGWGVGAEPPRLVLFAFLPLPMTLCLWVRLLTFNSLLLRVLVRRAMSVQIEKPVLTLLRLPTPDTPHPTSLAISPSSCDSPECRDAHFLRRRTP